jgi:hypothetical protein
MRKGKMIAVLLLFSGISLLTTCQFQFNKSAGNNVSLRIDVPQGGSSGAQTVAAAPRSLAHGTTVSVTISQEGTAFTTQQTVSINGQTSIDLSFSLTSNGVYDVTAVMKDAGGSTFATGTTKLTVPAGNYPVVLSMHSNLLFSVAVTDNSGPLMVSPPFIPSVNSGYTFFAISYNPPYTLLLDAVDPGAAITVKEFDGTNTYVNSSSGPAYPLQHYLPSTSSQEVSIVVTAQDGSSTQTYTILAPYTS